VQFDTFSYEVIHSTPGVRSDLFYRPLNETLLTDFFGGVSEVDLLSASIDDPTELEDEVDGNDVQVKTFGTGRRKRSRAHTAEELMSREVGIPSMSGKTLLLASGVAAVNIGALWVARRRKL
jgi:phosphatidylinositol glycan class K